MVVVERSLLGLLIWAVVPACTGWIVAPSAWTGCITTGDVGGPRATRAQQRAEQPKPPPFRLLGVPMAATSELDADVPTLLDSSVHSRSRGRGWPDLSAGAGGLSNPDPDPAHRQAVASDPINDPFGISTFFQNQPRAADDHPAVGRFRRVRRRINKATLAFSDHVFEMLVRAMLPRLTSEELSAGLAMLTGEIASRNVRKRLDELPASERAREATFYNQTAANLQRKVAKLAEGEWKLETLISSELDELRALDGFELMAQMRIIAAEEMSVLDDLNRSILESLEDVKQLTKVTELNLDLSDFFLIAQQRSNGVDASGLAFEIAFEQQQRQLLESMTENLREMNRTFFDTAINVTNALGETVTRPLIQSQRLLDALELELQDIIVSSKSLPSLGSTDTGPPTATSPSPGPGLLPSESLVRDLENGDSIRLSHERAEEDGSLRDAPLPLPTTPRESTLATLLQLQRLRRLAAMWSAALALD